MLAQKAVNTIVKKAIEPGLDRIADPVFSEECPHEGCSHTVLAQSQIRKTAGKVTKEWIKAFINKDFDSEVNRQKATELFENLGVEPSGTMLCCAKCRGFIRFTKSGKAEVISSDSGFKRELD